MANPLRRLSANFMTAVTSKPPVRKWIRDAIWSSGKLYHGKFVQFSLLPIVRRTPPNEWRTITVHVQLVNPWKNPALKSFSFSWKCKATRPSKQLGTPSWTFRIDIVTRWDPAFSRFSQKTPAKPDVSTAHNAAPSPSVLTRSESKLLSLCDKKKVN